MSGSLSLRRILVHEMRLAWRDWSWWIRKRPPWRVALGLFGFFAFMQTIALAIVSRVPADLLQPNRQSYLLLSASLLLSWTMMISQAIEQVTRVFYARGDLDLLLSSPVSPGRLFSVRLALLAASVTGTAFLALVPFVNALIVFHGLRFFAAYGLMAAVGMSGAALAAALAVFLFRTVGPRQARFVAQIVAAIVGAAFVIGIQVAAVVSLGQLGRYDWLRSPAVLARAPSEASIWWWPARALLGETLPLAVLFALSALLLALVVRRIAPGLGKLIVTAAGAMPAPLRRTGSKPFRSGSAAGILREKEWRLILRDPWLASQTVMQLFYLIPPAILLWHNFGAGDGAIIVVAPLIVMTAGQLAGGLMWLAVSGEDAPELLATAPIRETVRLRAKTQAVMTGVAVVLLPLIAALSIRHPLPAAACLPTSLAAALASSRIQLWFRTQASRSQFRRRQTSSRIATFAEAFSSILWAATASFAAVASPVWPVPAVLALLALLIAYRLRPR